MSGKIIKVLSSNSKPILITIGILTLITASATAYLTYKLNQTEIPNQIPLSLRYIVVVYSALFTISLIYSAIRDEKSNYLILILFATLYISLAVAASIVIENPTHCNQINTTENLNQSKSSNQASNQNTSLTSNLVEDVQKNLPNGQASTTPTTVNPTPGPPSATTTDTATGQNKVPDSHIASELDECQLLTRITYVFLADIINGIIGLLIACVLWHKTRQYDEANQTYS